MEVEIISKEEIKPASPTPHHLRSYRISILDQLTPHVYTNPFVFFYPNNVQSAVLADDTILERRQCLKKSLSESLVHFYPLAGKIKDNQVVECTDDGVFYVEARVNIQLSDFLRNPINREANRLLPFHPGSADLLSRTYFVMIQVNIFDCGGIAIGLYASHKIVDGLSLLTFMKSWAATARNSSQETIHPSFISPSVFLPNPILPTDLSLLVHPAPSEDRSSCTVTRRFVFNRNALAALKAKTATSSFPNPSSATVVMGFLWKCAMTASSARWGFQKRSVVSLAVNLRTRNSPSLPPNSFGNIFWLAYAECKADSDNQELHLIARKIRNAVARIDNDFVQGIRGENRTSKLMEHLKELKHVYCDNNSTTDYFAMSSMCKGGIYEVDFGWGQPIWTCIGSGGTDIYGAGNLMVLVDTRSGDGIEAWVTMKEEAMAFLENNSELRAFASLDPNPLENNHCVFNAFL